MASWWIPGLLLLSLCVSCFADPTVDELLGNGQGKPPCDLVDEIQKNAACTQIEQKVDGFPNLNKCTCSSSFFAVYSMCKISERNYGNLTSAESWKKECKSLNFETTKQDGDGGVALSYPKWANPDWGSYDEGYYNVLDLFHVFEQDFQEQDQKSRMQLLALILLPVLGTVIITILGIMGFYWYRNRNRIAHKRREASYRGKHLLGVAVPFTKPVVRRASTSEQWEIDQPQAPKTRMNLDTESFREEEEDEEESAARPQHIRLRSTDSSIDKQKKPWWPNIIGSVTSRRRNSTITKGSSLYVNDKDIRTTPDEREVVYTGITDSTLANYRQAGFREPLLDPSSSRTALAPLQSQRQQPVAEEEQDDFDYVDEPIMPPAPRGSSSNHHSRNGSASIMLISRGNRDDFTIESGQTASTGGGSWNDPSERSQRAISRDPSYATQTHSSSSSRSASQQGTPRRSQNDRTAASYGMRRLDSDFTVASRLHTPPPPWHEVVGGRPLPVPGFSPPYRHSPAPADEGYHDPYSRPGVSSSHRYPDTTSTAYPPLNRQGS